MDRTRTRIITANVLALAFASAAVAAWPRAREPVYSVAALRARLERDPRGWTGRTVLVYAVALRWCTSWRVDPEVQCLTQSPTLFDANLTRAYAFLPLTLEQSPALLAALHRSPLLDRLLPPQPVIHWGRAATYRIALRLLPCPQTGAVDCMEAVVSEPAL